MVSQFSNHLSSAGGLFLLSPICHLLFVLAGVWFGPAKPPPHIVLRPILDEIRHLHTVGIDVSTPNGHRKVHAKLLLTVCDLPAKAMVLNQKQYNGFYGCS